MKLYISADLEGTAGVCCWPETDPENRAYPYFANEMTEEVRSACEGAIAAGAKEILVKDAHDSARNIHPDRLPEPVRIMRGWTRGPESMMGGMDSSFQAAAMIGYHTSCATNGNPLSHTMDTKNDFITLNGTLMSEFMMNAYTAAWYGVPVVFISGDKMICESATSLIPSITAVPVSEGIGNASISLQPAVAQRAIRKGMEKAMSGDLSKGLLTLPKTFELVIRFNEHFKTYRASFYPGAETNGMKEVVYRADDWYDVLKFMLFVL